jgi:hypothetical protein
MVQTMSDYVKKINYKNVKEYERDLVTNKKIILKILKRNDKNKINATCHSLKKSFPLLSTTMNAGKFSTCTFHIASIPVNIKC